MTLDELLEALNYGKLFRIREYGESPNVAYGFRLRKKKGVLYEDGELQRFHFGELPKEVLRLAPGHLILVTGKGTEPSVVVPESPVPVLQQKKIRK